MKRHLTTLAAAVALTVIAATAWAYWSAGSVPGSSGAAAASSVNQGATPTASATGSTVTVSWSATTLANGQAVSGYLVKRYDAGTSVAQTILSACTGTITATSCVESNVPNGSWKYAVTPVFATNWQGPESSKSTTVTISSDSTPPTNAISLSSVTGDAYLSGTTIYYRGTAAGSLRLTNAVADSGSGPASSATAALTGTTTGWTHNPSTVSTPAGGPYVSSPFSWTAGTTSNPGEAVTGRDVADNTVVTDLSFVNDSTPPTAGTISYADGFTAGRSASISFTTGTDAGSGIATRRLQRAAATLTGTTCGSFGAFTDIGADAPTSPYVDSSLASACFKYRYVVTDRVGNQDIATSTNVVKVGYAGAVGATSGLLSHWRLGEASAAPTSSDSFTDTSGTLLTSHTGELAANWTRQAGAANATISNENRIYRAGGGHTINYTSLAPATADYSVEADLVVKSNVAGETVGVFGRLNTATNTFYMARWEQADTSWNIVKYTNGSVSWLDFVSGEPALTVGQSYRLKLEMIGSTLNLYVNGVLKASATDASLTAAGRAGIMTGASAASVAQSNTTGVHLDNFQVTPAVRVMDSKGTNHGVSVGGVTLGATGALPGDTDTAATFDGLNDVVSVPDAASLRPANLTLEAWVRPNAGIQDYASVATKTTADSWSDGYGMYSFGGNIYFWVNDDPNDVWTPALPTGTWTHVAGTYDGAALKIYVNGALAQSFAYSVPLTHSTAPLLIGDAAGVGNYHWNGGLDEVSFYNRALTAAEVADHYQLGAAPALDLTGPTGGSVDATGLVGTGSRYSTSTTLSLALAKGTDPSGVATSGNQLLRATATLTDGSCGSFGSYTLVTGGTDPASPFADTVVDQACYSYQYVVKDTLGNATTYTSPNIKVDTTAPATPTLAFSAFANTWWPGSGSTVYYRPGAASGSVTATATATDAASGIASYAFPALGTGWTATPGALGATTYSWSAANPAAPGTKNITATNNASLASANAPFTLTADSTAPDAGTVSYADTTQTSTSVSVSFTTGSDGGSGVGTRLLQRASAPLAGGTCGTYGAFATVAGGTNPSSPFTDTVSGAYCYKYQYVVSDNVGNTHTATSANVVKVAASCGDQLLHNGGFENGADATPWTESPADVVTNAGTVAARTGSWKALLGGQGTDTTETLSQQVTIPANCTATLTYHLRVTTSEFLAGQADFFRVQVGGTTVQTFSDDDAGGSYVQRTVDLSAYAGQTVTLSFLADEALALQTSFWVDDVAISTALPTYTESVTATSGLVNYYRLGEATTSADSMAGTTGATLQSRAGETAATWTKHPNSSTDAVLTNAGRVRKAAANSHRSLYYTSAVPASADYTVEADIYVASNLANDIAGVVGRVDTANVNGTYYVARYDQLTQRWLLFRVVNDVWTWLGESGTQALTAGSTYRLAMSMTGSTIRVWVNGVQQFSAVDGSPITAAGRGGIAMGFHGSANTTVTDAAGMHLDNFRISPPMVDTKGANHVISSVAWSWV